MKWRIGNVTSEKRKSFLSEFNKTHVYCDDVNTNRNVIYGVYVVRQSVNPDY